MVAATQHLGRVGSRAEGDGEVGPKPRSLAREGRGLRAAGLRGAELRGAGLSSNLFVWNMPCSARETPQRKGPQLGWHARFRGWMGRRCFSVQRNLISTNALFPLHRCVGPVELSGDLLKCVVPLLPM